MAKLSRAGTAIFIIKYATMFIVMFFYATSCTGQAFREKLPIDKQRSYRSVPNELVREAVDITSYLPVNYSRTGNVDYTTFLQKGIEDNRVLLMPDFPVLINYKGLHIPSNTTIIFQKKSRLKMKPNAHPKFSMLEIYKKNNIKIFNSYLIGDNDEHLGKDGEWGMGINIISSSNIEIYEPFITNSWGDAIYIGNQSNGNNNNIKVEGGILDNNRRNGISVISATNLYISNIYISNTIGTLPMAGIDIEPNDPTSKLINLNFNKVKTFNSHTGFQISLNYFGSKQTPKDAVIVIDDLEVNKHDNGFLITGFTKNPGFKVMEGSIKLNKVKITDARKEFIIENHFGIFPSIIVSNFSFGDKRNGDVDARSRILRNVQSKLKFKK